MKTAVIYARFSCERQTEQSIEGQIHVCEDYAARNDIIIVDKYIDRAMTGTNDNRKDFQRMLKDCTKQAWDYVLVYKLDRFSRNKYETAIHKKTLRDNGIKLLSACEAIPDAPEGIILESLLEGMAEYYSAELSQKVKRGMRELRSKGYYMGGYLLYGYKKDGKKVVIDEEKAEVVRYIFDEYLHGTYMKTIIANLTARGILNRGKPFVVNTLDHMLENMKYTGCFECNGEL
ncbi:MAG: recombinase family protein, partial [Clostridia bacterium]|nr:recombinase family protein [Clostridia bacterium]